ncbi:MAG: hypothetical protein ACPHID_00245 [Thermoplasmatota archaeon]
MAFNAEQRLAGIMSRLSDFATAWNEDQRIQPLWWRMLVKAMRRPLWARRILTA